MASQVIRAARFDGQSSAAGGGLGIFIASIEPITINNLGYAVRDPAAVLYQPGVFFLGRIAIIRGLFADSPDNFVEGYNLQNDGYSVILDAVYTGFGGLVSFGGGQDSGYSLRGQGLTALIGPPTVVGGSGVATPVLQLFGSSGTAAAQLGGQLPPSQTGSGTRRGFGAEPRSIGGGGRSI